MAFKVQPVEVENDDEDDFYAESDLSEATFQKPWNTMWVAMAYHSKDQDVIYQTIMQDVNENKVDWEFLQKLSVPLWLKDKGKLSNMVEMVAKNRYQSAVGDIGKDSRAELTAMWYILINKKTLLCTLYKTEPNS